MKKARTSKGTRVTEKDFNIIKELQTYGASQTDAMKATKRSSGTVNTAYHSETYAEFNKKRAYKAPKPSLPKEQKQLVDMPMAPYQPMDIPPAAEKDEVQEIIDNLTDMQRLVMATNRLADGVERIAEVLENQPVKKGWLK